MVLTVETALGKRAGNEGTLAADDETLEEHFALAALGLRGGRKDFGAAALDERLDAAVVANDFERIAGIERCGCRRGIDAQGLFASFSMGAKDGHDHDAIAVGEVEFGQGAACPLGV